MTATKNFRPQAIIFDKDGTLIDFDVMWGGWTIYLAKQLHLVSGLDPSQRLCQAFGVEEKTGKVLPNGKLASMPMSWLYHLTNEVMRSFGMSASKANQIVEQAWCIPDPVVLAKPFTDLRALFGQLTEQDIKIAIATADDRTPTQALVDAFDIGEYIACMACADDGIPSKPAPDMVFFLCEQMNVEPSKVMVIGDTTSDLKMARAAGAGLAMGVLSGVSSTRELAEFADLLLDSIAELNEYDAEFTEDSSRWLQTGRNPDFVFQFSQ